MKRLIEALRAARRLEIFIAAAALCALLALWMGGAADTSPSGEEARMERALSRIEGAGRVTVMISRGEGGEAEGALVVASGAGDVRVALALQRAVQTLTGLELERIEIEKSGR